MEASVQRTKEISRVVLLAGRNLEEYKGSYRRGRIRGFNSGMRT